MSDNIEEKVNNSQNNVAFWFLAICVLIVVLLIGGMLFWMQTGRTSNPNTTEEAATLAESDGKQTVTITAKGGYSPSVVTAKANTPTKLILKTNNTFDCSSAVTIPAINYKKNLPMKGETVVEIPAQEAGKEIDIVCSMGMYSSKIKFN